MSKRYVMGPCPRCGSRDNLATYSDGSSYCYGCGLTGAVSELTRLKSKDKYTDTSNNNPFTKELRQALPLSFLLTQDKKYHRFLTKYLTPEEVKALSPRFDKNNLCTLIPIHGEHDDVAGILSRNFGTGASKYKLKGSKDTLNVSFGKGDKVVFTEDLVSAIVVGRVSLAVPIFGTALSQKLVQRYKDKQMLLWLDRDKMKDSIAQCQKYRQYGYNIHPIFSDLDPKEYSNDTILSLLTQ